MTKIVTQSVIVLLMDGIKVKMNYSFFSCNLKDSLTHFLLHYVQ